LTNQIKLKDLADNLGLSITTVSRVLNGKSKQYRISEKTTKKVLDLAKKTSFSPNLLARSLRLRRSKTIGMIVPDITNPFFAKIIKSVEREAKKKQYFLLLSDSDDQITNEENSMKSLISNSVDGIIIAPIGVQSIHIKKQLKKKTPVVFVDRWLKKMNYPFIGSDNFLGAYQATEYLIQKGHQRLCCLQGVPDTFPNRERVHGFKKACSDYFIADEDQIIVGNSFHYENGYRETKKILKTHNPPTAIFSLSNLISLGALNAITEVNLNIPSHISFISFDEQPYSKFLTPPMTTIMQQVEDIGALAFKTLLKIIEGSSEMKAQKFLLPTQLIIRKSVRDLLQDRKTSI